MDIESTVRWLKDRELIKELPLRYARGIDRIDFDLVRSNFHPDCQVFGTVVSGPLDPYLDWTENELRKYESTLHVMGNQYVDLEEGADEGHVETYAVAYQMQTEESGLEDLILGLRYCDDVARFDEGWLITARTAVPQWVRGPVPHAPDELRSTWHGKTLRNE
ncbi:nuclear transport factor 2 family protein [Candidatus Poriferisocius sp.]|uniref:nuclear transport factor 2 family protein n=1 Tax=Candidatus Poriferisocius sp. TaxID=3101276 RepID=UPI003B5CB560